MGSLNEFGWLSTENVTFLQQAIETRYEIPLRLMARGFSSLIARKNFDSAQDDIQWVGLAVCFRDFSLVLFRPYCFLSTPTKRSITFFKKMYVMGVFKGGFLWYNIYLVCFLNNSG